MASQKGTLPYPLSTPINYEYCKYSYAVDDLTLLPPSQCAYSALYYT